MPSGRHRSASLPSGVDHLAVVGEDRCIERATEQQESERDRGASASNVASPPNPAPLLLSLQGRVGNRAVARLVADRRLMRQPATKKARVVQLTFVPDPR